MITFRDLGNFGRPFTFHVVHRTHMELFNFAYYPCWSSAAHQDPYLYGIYRQMNWATLLIDLKVSFQY